MTGSLRQARAQARMKCQYSLDTTDFSVTSSLQLSSAQFRDEQTWPQFQLGVYKKILTLGVFFGFEG